MLAEVQAKPIASWSINPHWARLHANGSPFFGGFIIAEKDLEIRGPGELLGTRQTGQLNFRIADLVEDGHLVDQVHHQANELNQGYPEIVDQLIQRWLGRSQDFIEA